jgi:hypothetical protein
MTDREEISTGGLILGVAITVVMLTLGVVFPLFGVGGVK